MSVLSDPATIECQRFRCLRIMEYYVRYKAASMFCCLIFNKIFLNLKTLGRSLGAFLGLLEEVLLLCFFRRT